MFIVTNLDFFVNKLLPGQEDFSKRIYKTSFYKHGQYALKCVRHTKKDAERRLIGVV